MELSEAISTGVSTTKRSFTWTIENFDIIRKSNDHIDSQRFTFKTGETIGFETEWICYLKRCTEKYRGRKINWIGCFIQLDKAPMNVDELNARFQVGIRIADYQGIFFKSTSPLRTFNGDGHRTGCGWENIIQQNAKLENLPLVNGCLILKLEFQLFTAKSQLKLETGMSVAAIEKNYEVKFSKKLQQDLGKFLASCAQNSDADVTIVTQDKNEFAATRGILSVRSPWFERKLKSGTRASKTGIIFISDVSSETMTLLLQFIYTGILGKDWSSADVIVELTRSAGKYELLDLLEFLNHVLGSVCTVETVRKLRNVTKQFTGLKKARQDLQGFMKKNNFLVKDVMSSTQNVQNDVGDHDFDEDSIISDTSDNDSLVMPTRDSTDLDFHGGFSNRYYYNYQQPGCCCII